MYLTNAAVTDQARDDDFFPRRFTANCAYFYLDTKDAL